MSNGTATLPNEGVSVSEVGSPIFFGSIISLILMGVTVVQSWTYFNNNRDSLRLRCFVSTIVVLNIACTCLLIVELYSHLILHFGSDPMLVVLPTKSLGVELLLNIFIIILVDFFLANQIRNLGQTHWSVVVVVVFAATVAFGIVFSTCTMSLASPSLSEVLFATQLGLGLIGTGNALFTCAEVVASIALAWSLHHSKTGIRRTDGILTKLFTWMVTRGLLLSVIQVLSMAFYFANPLSPHWIPFHLLQSKLYVITTLSLLNSRKSLRRQINLFNSTFNTDYSGSYTAATSEQLSRSQGRGTMNISYPLVTNEGLQGQLRSREFDLESSVVPESPIKSRSPSFAPGFSPGFGQIELQMGKVSEAARRALRPGPEVFISREQIVTTD